MYTLYLTIIGHHNGGCAHLRKIIETLQSRVYLDTILRYNVCCLGHIAQTCTAVLYGSTPHHSSSIKKLKASYNGVLRRPLLIVKPYSASEMFVTHNIPSFYELLRKCIYSFRERISHSANKIIKACKIYRPSYLSTPQSDNGGFCQNFLPVKYLSF